MKCRSRQGHISNLATGRNNGAEMTSRGISRVYPAPVQLTDTEVAFLAAAFGAVCAKVLDLHLFKKTYDVPFLT